MSGKTGKEGKINYMVLSAQFCSTKTTFINLFKTNKKVAQYPSAWYVAFWRIEHVVYKLPLQ